MKVLVLGATGGTGSLVARQLINLCVNVKVVIRSASNKLNDLSNIEFLETIVGNIAEFDLNKNIELIMDCDAVICCLGHNINFKGIFGKPRMLVSDSIKNICNAIERSKKEKVKLILMNTTANTNINLNENYSRKDRIILSLLKLLLPPHKDNVEAGTYLSKVIGDNNSKIEWIAVRPDTLINEDNVSVYEIVDSPKRSPVFDAGKTSRINVAYFMVELLLKEEFWNEYKFKMPVIYNKHFQAI
ncbi:MAG: NAD(P)H-binding protein [Ignavibacterium sp.]|nr:NAD(P)H-binding protein [Ignavibacterium sp.]MDX9712390.1 NAD(P)H-binding protein [Ignavibacteriaceae bacterium]